MGASSSDDASSSGAEAAPVPRRTIASSGDRTTPSTPARPRGRVPPFQAHATTVRGVKGFVLGPLASSAERAALVRSRGWHKAQNWPSSRASRHRTTHRFLVSLFVWVLS